MLEYYEHGDTDEAATAIEDLDITNNDLVRTNISLRWSKLMIMKNKNLAHCNTTTIFILKSKYEILRKSLKITFSSFILRSKFLHISQFLRKFFNVLR